MDKLKLNELGQCKLGVEFKSFFFGKINHFCLKDLKCLLLHCFFVKMVLVWEIIFLLRRVL